MEMPVSALMDTAVSLVRFLLSALILKLSVATPLTCKSAATMYGVLRNLVVPTRAAAPPTTASARMVTLDSPATCLLALALKLSVLALAFKYALTISGAQLGLVVRIRVAAVMVSVSALGVTPLWTIATRVAFDPNALIPCVLLQQLLRLAQTTRGAYL